MAIAYNRSIVTTNLIACFDPGNPRTYPGSGTTISDASGNGYTGTLTNGPTYSAVNGGVFVLDGVNDFIDIPMNLSATNYTIVGAARYVNAATGGRTFSAKNNNWLMGHWNTSTENYYAEGWVAGAGTGGPTPSDTNWRIYAATGNISSDNYALYVNGSLVSTQAPTAGSAGPNGFAIGSVAGAGEFSNSQIGFMLVYNAVLTADQIIQNFNAYRGRYGI